MRSVVPIKAAKIGYIVMSALFCVLGVFLFVMPEVYLPLLGRLLGVGMIIFGVIKLVGYFSRDLFRLAFQYDFAFGILLIALGVITLTYPNDAMSFLCVVFGIQTLSDSLFKVQISMDSKRFGIGSWWLILVLAVLTGVIGTILVFRPEAGAQGLTMLVGLSLFMDGVLNLGVAILTVKIIRRQRPDVIEAEYEIRKD